MKVKSSSSYHTQSAQGQKHASSGVAGIHQPVLTTSSHGGPQSNIYLLSSTQKDTKSPSKTGTMAAKQAASANKAQQMMQQNQAQGQQQSVSHFSHGAPLSHPSQQLQGTAGSSGPGPLTMADLQQTTSIQQTPGQMKNSVKTVNLSFTGTDFAHRNMSSSMHNGFYVNSQALEDYNRKQASAKQANAQMQISDHRAVSHYQSNHNSNVGGGVGGGQPSNPLNHQYAGASGIGNTNSLRSLGVGQRSAQVSQQLASSQNTAQGGNNHGAQIQTGGQNSSNFSSVAQGVFTTLHMHNTPGQKKTVSSKNQQRRKISATNQSTQFQTSGNMLLQGQNQYPQSMKKKSSKAKMIVADANAANQIVTALQGSSQNQQMMMGRTQSSKMQPSMKGSRPGELADDCNGFQTGTNEVGQNVFLQDSRLSHTMTRGYQQQMQASQPPPGADNIFQIAQSPEGNAVQVAYSGNQMHGYIISKQLQGVQTPSGYKQVAMVQPAGMVAPDGFTFQAGDQAQLAARYSGGGSSGQNNLRAKTMGPAVGLQMLPPGKGQSQQQQLLSAQASAKLNKNYLKVAPQYDLTHNSYAKSQQRSYQSLQAQQLSMLNQAVMPPGSVHPQATSPQPSHTISGSTQSQVHSQQQAFVYGRKLVSMKASNADVSGNTQLSSAQLTGSETPIQGQVMQGKLNPQMQSSYHRVLPSQMNSTNGSQGNPEMVVSQRPSQFESDQPGTLEPLQLQKMSSTKQQQLQGQPIVLNQAQIQFIQNRNEAGQMPQQTTEIPISQGLMYAQQQSAQKNTNLIVRIDNSNAANHQITKRKRLKDSGPIGQSTLRNGAGIMGDPSESEQMSNEGQSQRRTVFIENIDAMHLPVFVNYAESIYVNESETGSVHPQSIKEAMANSQQNFNSYSLALGGAPGTNGRNATHITAESMVDNEGGNTKMELHRIENQGSSRNNERYNQPGAGSSFSKPSSAVVNTRAASLQASQTVPNGQNQSRPDSKQGGPPVMMSAKKKFDQELAARDALIGIDDEDEHQDQHMEFSEQEDDSQSADNQSNDENNFQFNKSVDSDKLGKSGSFSYRQNAGLKLVQQNSSMQVSGGGAAAANSSNQNTLTNAQRFGGESDVDSENSSTQHAQQLFLYNAQGSNPREANLSYNNLASDSETDGNFSDTGSCFGRGTTMREDGAGGPGNHDDIDGISEHSSDEADSESEPDETKKKEKVPGEQKPKRKKKKAAAQDEKGATKKVKGDKDNAKSQPKTKEKAQAAPAKKNFTEVKEKEYNAKSKSKNNSDAAKVKAPEAREKQKPAKVEKAAKAAAETVPKVKKVKSTQEETKGAAAAGNEASIKESPQKKKQKQKLNLALVHTQPKNIEEQRALFFESNCTVNPVFEYENYAATQKFLAQWKEPSDELLNLSTRILESFIEIYGSESNYLETEGEVVSREETLTVFTDYLEALGFEDLLTVNFKTNQVAPTSVTHDPKTGKSRVNIRDPPEYRRGRLHGVIDHEIGTHYIRKFNERFQVWHKKREKWEMKSCIQTEEGFACVNQLVRTAWDGKHPFLYRSALNYYAAYMSSKLSFVELFNDIEKFIDSRMSRWKFVLRLKRGLIETSEPGGLYKDQCYLEGAVEFLKHRRSIDIFGLFTGKISLEDLRKPKIQKVLNKENLKLPTFVEDMEKYYAALDIIAKTNHIETLPAE